MEESSNTFRLHTSKNGMAVMLDCRIPGEGLDSLVAAIAAELESMGIKDPPDIKTLKEQILAAGKSTSVLKNFVLLRGREPVPPVHGRTLWSGDYFITGFVRDERTGAVDYRRRAAKPSVREGRRLGKRLPPTEGKDGYNVFGKTIPANKPKLFYPMPGKNVRFDVTEGAYYAEKDGRVRLAKDILSVDEVYVIKGDVDLETGNISHYGAVVIEGDILKGAFVEAAGDIEVFGVVEGAEIHSRGNLIVHGGITKAEGQKILVAGSVHAKFILDGNVRAYQDVIVEREIVSSTVKTLGSLTVPRGRIVGGEVVALRGIFISQAGTLAGVPTLLTAGYDFTMKQKLLEKKKEIKEVRNAIAEHRDTAEELRSRENPLSKEESEILEEAQAGLADRKKDLQNLREEVAGIRKEAMSRAKKLIVVEKTLHAKTTVSLGRDKLVIEEERVGPLRIEMHEGAVTVR